jgi:hypothetical protein
MRASFITIGTISIVSLFAFSAGPFSDYDDIKGTWVRKDDKLAIIIKQENGQLFSNIVNEGTEKFPCDVSAYHIYKNIVKIKDNLWRCDFLVVTIGSCATDYEEGMIQMNNQGDIEITCPGFSKKYYTKLKPRYEANHK